MKILVACEESQAVTKELRDLGHEAFSCDILECGGNNPEWHIMDDVRAVILNTPFHTQNGDRHVIKNWDMMIAFPPCTHLSVSGARHFEGKRKDGRQKDAINFFMALMNADIPKIAIENPVNIIGGKYIPKHFPDLMDKYSFRSSDQIIQPYEFGDEAQKTTCLWLKGLPKLIPTNIVGKGEFYTSPSGKRLPKWYNKNSNGKKTRQQSRSVTFKGIAKAMATQWTQSKM